MRARSTGHAVRTKPRWAAVLAALWGLRLAEPDLPLRHWAAAHHEAQALLRTGWDAGHSRIFRRYAGGYGHP